MALTAQFKKYFLTRRHGKRSLGTRWWESVQMQRGLEHGARLAIEGHFVEDARQFAHREEFRRGG